MSLAGTNFLGRALAARTRQVRVSGAQALEFAVLAHVITTFRECAPASRRGVLLSWVHHEPPPANLSLRSVPKRATPSETSVGAHRDTSGIAAALGSRIARRRLFAVRSGTLHQNRCPDFSSSQG